MNNSLNILALTLVILLITGCTTTNYSRVAPDGTRITLDHSSVGMEREDIDLNFEKPDDLIIGVTIGRSSGAQSLNRVIDGLEETLKTLKSMRP